MRKLTQVRQMNALASAHMMAVVVVIFALVVVPATRGQASERAGKRACDEFVAGVLAGRPTHILPTPTAEGWDNDRVIDAWIKAMSRGVGAGLEPPSFVAGRFARHEGLYSLGEPLGPRALDLMLPSRIERALLDMIRPDPARLHADPRDPRGPIDAGLISRMRPPVILALGSIDDPSPEAVSVVIAGLTDENSAVQTCAIEAVGMLGSHAIGAAPVLERLLESAAAGAPGERHTVRMTTWHAQVEIAGALARVSEGAHDGAVSALAEAVFYDGPESAERALEHLRALGSRGEHAVGPLRLMLAKPHLDRPTVSHVITAISPELLPAVVEELASLSASDDLLAAWSAERELFALSRVSGDSPEMREIVPALIATLDSRVAADGLALSKTLREIDDPLADEAYAKYLRRERRERGATGGPQTTGGSWFSNLARAFARDAAAEEQEETTTDETDDD